MGSAFVLMQLHDLPSHFVLNTVAKPVEVATDDSRVEITIQGYKSVKSQRSKDDLAQASGLSVDDIADCGYFMNSGTQQLLIELTNRQALTQLQVDSQKLHAINADNPFKITDEPSVYYWFEQGEEIHSRMFFEQNRVMVEDSGTGSACANLGAYFILQNQYPVTKYILQGDDMGRPNRLSLKVDAAQNIFVGGNVIEVGNGEFYLP